MNPQSTDKSNAKILIVDDNLKNLRLLTIILKEAGYTVRQLRSGKMVLASVLSAPPDLILLDILMPEVDGYDVCQQLKAEELSRDIPVIFISALDATIDKVKAFSVGGVDYVPKPFEPEEVLLRVETHLALQKAQKALKEKNEALQHQIAERKRAEEQIRQQKEAAEAANRAKSTFLANMSHELRTPLNAILGFSQLMAGDPNLTPEQKADLETIGRSGEHLLGLINDILELSKIEAGQMVLQAESFNLYRMLTALSEMFRLRTEAKALALIFEQAPDLPQYVRMDGGKLRQVLINLLNNAVKFTKEGHVTLRVSSKATPQPTRFLLLFEVTDSGVGIAPEELDAVFDAFVQTSSGQQGPGGTGLGMPISRAFVQMMGGSLTLSSEVGVGTTCKFEIPVERITRPQKQATQVIGLQPNQHAPDGGPYRLLVVEDHDDNRQLMIKQLKRLGEPPQGFDVREAANGKEAIEIWQQWKPHLIWMDMRMPVMDGLEATRRIKAAADHSPIIVALTAFAFEEDQARMLAEGCDEYVRKPFRKEDIYAVLAKHLNVAFIYQSIDEIEPTCPQAQETKQSQIASLLAAMPSQWLDDLRQFAFIGDLSGMIALVAQIRQAGSPDRPNDYLADKLTELINGFKWDDILTLMPKAVKN